MWQSRDKKELLAGIAAFVLMLTGWYLAWFRTPSEATMGDVYRIIYLHVPSAATALGVTATGLLIFSLLALWRPQEKYLRAQKAWSEVGLVFTIITLATGSIWGRPTWGTWWTWEARITTTLLLALLFLGYLLLHHSLPPGKQRIRICSILGILIFVDVPVIYKSVSWWRTLHQPASLIEERGRTMAPEMLSVLLLCIVFTIGMALALWRMRVTNLQIADDLENLEMRRLRS